MQIQFSKEGLQKYMVVPLTGEWRAEYEHNLFRFQEVPYFLSYEVRDLNGNRTLYYRMRYHTTLDSVMGHVPFTMDRMRNVVESMIGVLEITQEYLLEPEGIVWDEKQIFIEPDTGKLQFCYYPALEQQGGLRKLLTRLLQAVDKKQEPVMVFLLQFYNLITEPDCTLEDLLRFRDEQMGGQKIIENLVGQQHEAEEYSVSHEKMGAEPSKKSWGEKSGKGKINQEKNGVMIIRVALVIAALITTLLLFGLVFDVLTYVSMRYLLISVVVLIVLMVVNIQVGSGENPDIIMREYEEKMQQSPYTQEPYCAVAPESEKGQSNEDWRKACMQYNHSQMKTGVGDEVKVATECDGNQVIPLKYQDLYELQEENGYGETTVLNGETEENNRLVQEQVHGTLYLEALQKEKYPSVHLDRGSVVIGCMQEGCDYVLQERGISRLHAKLFKKGDGVYVLDLNSTNGTYINGEQLESGKDYKLEEGDMVAFAESEFYLVGEDSHFYKW